MLANWRITDGAGGFFINSTVSSLMQLLVSNYLISNAKMLMLIRVSGPGRDNSPSLEESRPEILQK